MWTSVPDSVLAKAYTASLVGTAPLKPIPVPYNTRKYVQQQFQAATQPRRDRQIACQLVCKAWRQAAGYAVTKGAITMGTVPTDLHVRMKGLKTLSLAHLNLSFDSYSDLSRLKQLHTLTLTDIGGHMHSLHQSLAEHHKQNTALNNKQRKRGLDGSAVHRVAAIPPSGHTSAELYNMVSPCPSSFKRSLWPADRQTAADQARTLRHAMQCAPPESGVHLDTATPFASRQESCAPFSFLTGLTELTLNQYPQAALPVQDMQQLSLLINVGTLTLKQIWGVTVPYQALASMSHLTALHIDTSQEEKSLCTLPAHLTGLKSLSVECTQPEFCPFLPVSSRYTALTALTMLSLTEVENVVQRDLASLTAFCSLERLSIKGRHLDEPGGQHWPKAHDWKGITAFTTVKHLDLDHIDHDIGICSNLRKLTQLTHLRLTSMQNVYDDFMQQDLMSLATLPCLHLLHCSFVCYRVRSTFSSDLEVKVLQRRGGPIHDFKIELITDEYSDYEVLLDDIDDVTAIERERDQQRELYMQQWYEEEYSESERRQLDRDPEYKHELFHRAGW
ncbi:hypothetical protein ABBQ32_009479 [Trebouxia sp. C0010 RCD-2024]